MSGNTGPSSDGAAAAPDATPSIRTAGALVLEIAETRLALLAVELEEQGVRLGRIALLAAASFIFFATGVVLTTTTLMFSIPVEYRLPALAVLAVCALAGGAVLYWLFRKSVGARPALFAASVGALRKDREQLVRREIP